MEVIGLGIGAWQYRHRQGYWPEKERWMLDYLLTNDLKTVTGIDIPEDYKFKSQHLSDIRNVQP